MMIFDLRAILLAAAGTLTLCVGLGLGLGYWLTQRIHAEQRRALFAQLSDLRERRRVAQQNLRLLAHEIRAPFTTIQTQAEVAALLEASSEARQKALEAIRTEARRAHHLIDAGIELARLDLTDAEETVTRPVNLIEMTETAVAQMMPLAEARQITLTMRVEGDLPLIPGDADRLRQVFLNVLDNAVKYGRAGDRVEVVLKAGMNAIACEVRDTGPGIPKAHLPYITRRLYRARTDVEGSGLGLAIVEEILRLHRSKLIIESQAEGAHTGTTCRFELPYYPS